MRNAKEGRRSGEEVKVMIYVQEETKLERYLADVAWELETTNDLR